MKWIEVTIKPETQKKCIDFVEAVYRTNKKTYKGRGQLDIAKVKKDIYRGKIAEYAVYEHYKHKLKFEHVTEPDISVYSASKKSYDADIVAIHNSVEYKMHIKSQHIHQAKSFELSWSFQKNDPLVFNPLPTDYIVACLLLSDKRVIIYHPIKARNVVKKYKKPKLKRLQPTKVVLYGSDVNIFLP
jgi:hypothetical protein